jgi:chromosome segregation ATPase
MSERSFWRGSVSFDESLPVFDKKPDEIETLRSRVAELESSALGGYEDGWHKLRSERDTLKARVSGLEAKLKYRHRKLAAVKQRAEAAEAEVERITAIIKREADLHNERQIRLEAAEAKVAELGGFLAESERQFQAKVAALIDAEAKVAELTIMLDLPHNVLVVKAYIEMCDEYLKRAQSAEAKVAELEAENAELKKFTRSCAEDLG